MVEHWCVCVCGEVFGRRFQHLWAKKEMRGSAGSGCLNPCPPWDGGDWRSCLGRVVCSVCSLPGGTFGTLSSQGSVEILQDLMWLVQIDSPEHCEYCRPHIVSLQVKHLGVGNNAITSLHAPLNPPVRSAIQSARMSKVNFGQSQKRPLIQLFFTRSINESHWPTKGCVDQSVFLRSFIVAFVPSSSKISCYCNFPQQVVL